MKDHPILFAGKMVGALLDERKTQTRRVMDFERVRVIPRRDIHAEFPLCKDDVCVARGGVKYPLHMNQHGAVCAIVDGKKLGLKPGEFDFTCPYTNGVTSLVGEKWHIAPESGSRLWVRETFCLEDCFDYSERMETPTDRPFAMDEESDQPIIPHYRATEPEPHIVPYKTMESPSYDENDDRTRWKPSIFMPKWACRIWLEITDVRVERVQSISDADVRAEGIPENAIDLWRQWLHPNDCAGHTFGILWDSINAKRGYGWNTNCFVWVITFKRGTGKA